MHQPLQPLVISPLVTRKLWVHFFSKKNQRFFLLQNFAKMTKIYSNKTKTEIFCQNIPLFFLEKKKNFRKKKKRKKVWKKFRHIWTKISPHLDFDFSLVAF